MLAMRPRLQRGGPTTLPSDGKRWCPAPELHRVPARAEPVLSRSRLYFASGANRHAGFQRAKSAEGPSWFPGRGPRSVRAGLATRLPRRCEAARRKTNSWTRSGAWSHPTRTLGRRQPDRVAPPPRPLPPLHGDGLDALPPVGGVAAQDRAQLVEGREGGSRQAHGRQNVCRAITCQFRLCALTGCRALVILLCVSHHTKTEPMSVRVPATALLAVDAFAQRCGIKRSAAIRDLLVSALQQHGLWPPREKE